MMNGWFIFNSRFSDVRADLRITSAAHYGSDTATGADHGRSLKSSQCLFYTHKCVYIIPATPRHVSEASQNLGSRESSCFAPGVIWHRMEDASEP